jgi:hypothetical protein
VSFYTAPSGVIAVAKGISVATLSLASGTYGVLSYQASGGPVIPILSVGSFGSPPNGLHELAWIAMAEGDQLLGQSGDGEEWSFGAWGAILVLEP